MSPNLHRQLLTRGLNDIGELQTEQEKAAGMKEIILHTHNHPVMKYVCKLV